MSLQNLKCTDLELCLSFELQKGIDPMVFQNHLQLIKPSMSLAGLESTTVSPSQTTHALYEP